MISRFARASMRSSSSGVTAWKWLKSKRRRSGASRSVDRGSDAVALGQLPAQDFRPVQHERAGNAVLRVEHTQLRAAVAGGERSGIAHLTARLGVEGRAVEDDVDLRTLSRLGEPLSAADEGEHFCVGRLVLVTAGELGLAEIVDELAVQLDGRRLLPALGLDRFARAGALLLHAGPEPVVVDAAAALLGDLAGEVDGKPESVVEEERALPRNV